VTGIRAAAWVAVIALGLWIVIAVTRGSAGTPPRRRGPPCPAGGSAAQASRGPASRGR
jgi:hypothetical protein